MRSMATLLEYELKRRPEIASLFYDIENVSVEEINGLKIPKWMRQEFLKEKIRNNNMAFEAGVASRMKIVDGFSPEIDGSIRRWTGCDDFLKIDRGGSIEIRSDKLVFFPKTGGVWLETVFSHNIDPKLYHTILVEECSTRTAYIMKYKDELLKRYSDVPVLFSMDDDSKNSTVGRTSAFGDLSAKYNVRLF